MGPLRRRVALGLFLGAVACDDETPSAKAPVEAASPPAAPKCPEEPRRVPLAQRLGDRVEKVAEACKGAEPLARDSVRDAEVTGRWKGEYQYDDGRPSNEIEVVLRVSDRDLSGEMSEPNTFGTTYPARVDSTITGDVYASGQVVFMKTYTSGGQTHSVLYTGELAESGRRIEGRWRIGGGSGPFWLAKE